MRKQVALDHLRREEGLFALTRPARSSSRTNTSRHHRCVQPRHLRHQGLHRSDQPAHATIPCCRRRPEDGRSYKKSARSSRPHIMSSPFLRPSRGGLRARRQLIALQDLDRKSLMNGDLTSGGVAPASERPDGSGLRRPELFLTSLLVADSPDFRSRLFGTNDEFQWCAAGRGP